MNVRTWWVRLAAASCAALACSAVTAQQDKPKDADKAKTAAKDAMGKAQDAAGGMTKEMMEACEKMGAVNENHKLLEYMLGNWDYSNKMWMGPGDPTVSTGTCTTRAIFDGRFFVSDHVGNMEMPGPDGKPVKREFKGTATTGYDNMKQRFVATWIDNMGTGIMLSEGTYEPGTKTFTFFTEMDDPMAPGTRVKVREVIRVLDKDRHVLEWFETRAGKENKAMEITYTRKK